MVSLILRLIKSVFKVQSDNFALYNLWGEMMRRSGWKLGDPLMGSRDREDNACLNYWLSDGKPRADR